MTPCIGKGLSGILRYIEQHPSKPVPEPTPDEIPRWKAEAGTLRGIEAMRAMVVGIEVNHDDPKPPQKPLRALAHLPLQVVGQQTQEGVGPNPGLVAMMNRADAQVYSLDGAKGALQLGPWGFA